MNKIKYEETNIYSPVFLKEYIIKEDLNRKFLLLHINNNTNKTLKNFKFEIIEFDNADNPVRKRTYEVNDLLVKQNSDYYIDNLLEINNETIKIEFKLIKAVFNDNTWEENSWKDELQYDGEILEKTSKTKIYKHKRGLYPIYTFVLLLGALITLLAFNHVKFIDNYDISSDRLFLVEENTLKKYYGRELNVIIPTFYNGSRINYIESNTFNNTLVKSIKIDSTNVYIKRGSFVNNMFLKSVTGESIETIESNSFSYNDKLKSIRFESVGIIERNAFDNSKNLRNLNIKKFENTIFKYEALNGTNIKTYYNYEDFEVFNNYITSFNSRASDILIKNNVKANQFHKHVFNEGNYINTIKIEKKNFTLSYDFLKDSYSMNPNIVIEVNKSIKLDDNAEAFINNSNMRVVIYD